MRRNAQFFQSQCESTRLKFEAVDAVAISEQVFRWRAEGKGFPQLLGSPARRRAFDDIKVENPAAVMGQNDEDVEDLKGEGRDGQEIDGDRTVEVIAKECLPVWRSGESRTRAHVFGDGSLGDIEAELEQFAVDSRSAPQRIGQAHLLDQSNGAWTDSLATRFTRPAFPAPEEPESGTVPLDDSARLNQKEPDLPICPRLREPRPEGAVRRGQAQGFVATVEDQELVSQSEVFEDQIPARVEAGESNMEQHREPREHGFKSSQKCEENRAFSRCTEFSPTHRWSSGISVSAPQIPSDRILTDAFHQNADSQAPVLSTLHPAGCFLSLQSALNVVDCRPLSQHLRNHRHIPLHVADRGLKRGDALVLDPVLLL